MKKTLYLKNHFSEEDNTDFNFVYKPFADSGASDRNPAVYFCLLNTIFARYEYE